MSVVIAPLCYQDRRYVFATSRRAVIAQLTRDETARATLLHERHLDMSHVRDAVDKLIEECLPGGVRVATVDGVGDDGGGRPEIQGFVVEDPRDESIEFLHLRETYRELSQGALAMGVVGALVRGRKDLVLRRRTSPTTLLALLATGAKVIVRPRFA